VNLQERRGGNQQVQLISSKPQGENTRVIVITRGGFVIGEDRVTPKNTIEESRVRRDSKKTQVFDPRKEKQTFEEARREFGRDPTSSSKTQP
jgi:flagellar biogenesis protein FliO